MKQLYNSKYLYFNPKKYDLYIFGELSLIQTHIVHSGEMNFIIYIIYVSPKCRISRIKQT